MHCQPAVLAQVQEQTLDWAKCCEQRERCGGLQDGTHAVQTAAELQRGVMAFSRPQPAHTRQASLYAEVALVTAASYILSWLCQPPLSSPCILTQYSQQLGATQAVLPHPVSGVLLTTRESNKEPEGSLRLNFTNGQHPSVGKDVEPHSR